MNMQDRSEKWLTVLGLAPGASEEAIKEAYRDLVKVWHPDRFGTDAPLRQKAEEKLRELNAAFGHLQNDRPAAPAPSTGGRSSGASDGRSPRDTAWSAVWPSGSTAPPALSISGRMATTLILSAATAAVGVWLVLTSRRAVDEPSGATGPLEAPTAQGQNHTSATPEKRQTTPSDPASVAATRVGQPSDSPAAPTTGSLRVESQPTGARVSFDGRAIGDTPLVVTDITPGEHQIGLDLNVRGYKRWSSSVVVAAGREEKLLAVMTPSTARR